MSKSKEELNALKKEVESVNEKLAELTEEEIAQVNGGATLLDHRYAGWRTAIPQFSRNSRVQSAGIDNEPWFGIWYSIIEGEVSPQKSKRPGNVPLKGGHDNVRRKENRSNRRG